MQRINDATSVLAWLGDRPETETMTGYDALGWRASTWVLHAMYENPSLRGLGTHDDLHKQRLQAGEVAPLFFGDVDLDEKATVTGTSLGFAIRPDQNWQRLRWMDYLATLPDRMDNLVADRYITDGWVGAASSAASVYLISLVILRDFGEVGLDFLQIVGGLLLRSGFFLVDVECFIGYCMQDIYREYCWGDDSHGSGVVGFEQER